MTEPKIDELIRVNIRCVEDDPSRLGCESCALSESGLCSTVHCDAKYRKDKKDVHFEIDSIA